ncbi:MAG: hypothetical protein JW807_02365 [Spirochaetes bacterium]|nr:hypothetical protein [Spirochaetota bacterium]
MFDIKEYFEHEYRVGKIRNDIVNIDDDLTHDINDLVSNRFDSLYKRDRYKNNGSVIEIIYPGLQYPGNNALTLNPDRVRYLLSFYPNKTDFFNIEKIVIRPRFIQIGNFELVSLYLRRKKILVLYLFHPHFYRMKYGSETRRDDPSQPNQDIIMRDRLTDDIIQEDGGAEVHVHPLWYLTSIVRHENNDRIDKFFIRKSSINDRMYEILNDISFYYSRHGY